MVLLGGNKIYVLFVINKFKKFKKKKERRKRKKIIQPSHHLNVQFFDVLLCSFLVVSNFG